MSKPASLFERAVTDAVLQRMAGEETYQRGFDYFSHGHVRSLEQTTGGIRTRVRGNQDYTVTLSSEDGILDYACDCPVGLTTVFCKHCVATALAWLNRNTDAAKTPSRRKSKDFTLADAAKVLQGESQETLVNMMLEWAKSDERVRDRLILYAARRAGPDRGASMVLRGFQNAVRVRRFLPYREAALWARGVDDAIDSIEQLLKDGQAAAVAEVCETALQWLDKATLSVDDSDGHFTALSGRLEDIHYRACLEAPPDPIALANRLFQLELQSEFDVFLAAAERYAKILGDKGLAAYRRLAEAVWAKVPQRAVKQDRLESLNYFRITHIMESLAIASGNIEELVAIISRDLSSGYNYLRIAETYRQAGQYENALLWAERGIGAFRTNTDPRLREFAANEYHRQERHADALNLIWTQFAEQPYLETYRILEHHASVAGCWPEWRERALAEIRARIAKAKEKARRAAHLNWTRHEYDHSLLVEIFLYEENAEAAWREATTGGCWDKLWLRLAVQRERDHPEDSVPIYFKYAEAGVVNSSNGRYQDPVNLLVKAAAAMKRLNRSADFLAHLAALRTKYRMKRNFIKLLDEKQQLLHL